jgi:hypothetical protein
LFILLFILSFILFSLANYGVMLLLAVASMMTGSTKGGPVGPSPVYAPKKAEYATEAPKYYTTKTLE